VSTYQLSSRAKLIS